MRRITISDTDPRGILSFDLRDLLDLLGARGLASTWRLDSVECTGGTTGDALHDASDAGRPLDGDELARLARGVGQIIEGVFCAFQPGADVPWVIIRAVDSAAFDVETDDEGVLGLIAERFSKVTVV